MRLVLVTALGLSFACATTMSTAAPAGSCAPATAGLGTTLYARPDSASDPIVAFKERTQVCADSEIVGFGFRHVKLNDGREGYLAASDLI